MVEDLDDDPAAFPQTVYTDEEACDEPVACAEHDDPDDISHGGLAGQSAEGA